LTFLSTEKCPVRMDLGSTKVYYYDKLEGNIWNPKGNGWKLEENHYIQIECHNPIVNPGFHCNCQTIKISANDTKLHEDSLGNLSCNDAVV